MRRTLRKPPPQAAFDVIVLCSHFQPIYSLPHQRQVGYEALLRGVASAGGLLEPFELFAKAIVESSTGALDRLSHVTHLHNAAKWLPGQSWLFLNVTPASFIDPGYAQQLAGIARDSGMRPEEIVIELLESGGNDVCAFAHATQAFRRQGFLVAVDDLGAGHRETGSQPYSRASAGPARVSDAEAGEPVARGRHAGGSRRHRDRGGLARSEERRVGKECRSR